MSLHDQRCVPCEGGVPPLDDAKVRALLPQVPDWKLVDGRLRRALLFDNFVAAMAFLNRLAALAEDEGHHPDFCVHYREVELTLFTHAIEGLSENDFILAAKIEQIVDAS